uniref:Isoform 3 of E3 ubiquitin-protein ligase Praja-1 n=1 Tax=Mus musculus TaxID=10090 RepID=O55176-4
MSHQERIASQRRTTAEVPMHRSTANQSKRSRSPFASTRRRWDDSESSGASLAVESEDYSRYPPREYRASGSRRGLAYGHIDTVVARDSEEEGAGPVDRLPVRGKAGKFKDDPEKGARSSRFTSVNHDAKEECGKVESPPAARCSARRAELSKQNGSSASQISSAEGRAAAKGNNSLERERQNLPARPSRAPVSICGNESTHELIQPGMFMLDGNNNLEDDSSVSEDLEVDWSLFDGFADGLGVAEAISYVDPQFLTYMALEERLAQAMETALAHLESLAVDVEVANPPASKESIDALPEILVTEDHGAVGQEMCCPICCSEYVKGEVATELPCHHYFHKPCVSIWLQKSGTCPVCRCMFPPPL